MKRKKLNFYLSLLCCMLIYNFGHTQNVTGTVTDADDGTSLIGANILIKGTSTGTVTDFDGNYSIQASEGDVLVFSYTGYTPLEMTVGTGKTINVQLSAGALLGEVVVVGYGVQNREEITGAVSSLQSKDFNKGNITSASELIQGKVAGLSMSKAGGDPNGSISIRMRGISTFGGATSPLILVDGITVNNLSEVDPNDIESISVLKDASSSAIYGARGSNGVILITTKGGGFEKKPIISYSGQFSVTDNAKIVPSASAEEYLSLPNAQDLGGKTDWIDAITRTGLSHAHNLAVDGGSSTTAYRLSASLRDVQGTLLNSGFNLLNLRGKVTHTAIDGRLKFNGDLAIFRGDRDFSFQEAFRYAATNNPTMKIYNPANTTNDGYNELDLFDYFNPLAIVEQNINQGALNGFKGSAGLDFNILDNLKISGSYATNIFTGQSYTYYSKQSRFRGIGTNGNVERNNFNTRRQTYQLVLNYNKSSFIHNMINFDGLLGYSYERTDNDGFNANNGDFISNDPTYNQLGSGSYLQKGLAGLGSYNNTQQLQGYFGRANFTINNIYNINTNVRYEGSNAFGPDEQYGLFYGIGASVNLSDLLAMNSVDLLKLRVSYGSTGNLPGGAYLYASPYSQVGYVPDGSGGFAPILGPSRDENPNLKWEEKKELNVGIDFDSRDAIWTGSLDYFNTTSKGLILNIEDSDLFPQTTRGFANVGSIKTEGLELLLSNYSVNNDNFSWTPTLTTTVYLNNVLSELNNPLERIANAGSPGNNNTPMILLEEGGGFGQIWGATFEGIDESGSPIFKDTNGDGTYVPADDNTVIGSGVPKFEIGFSNSFTYGQFDAQVFFRGAFGHDLVNMYRFFYENTAPGSYNRIVTKYFDENLSTAPERTISTKDVEDASFFKLDNVTVGYTLPVESNYFEDIRVFVNGQGLATFTGYTGADPEIRWSDGNDNRAPGIDRRTQYARPFTVTVGASLNIK